MNMKFKGLNARSVGERNVACKYKSNGVYYYNDMINLEQRNAVENVICKNTTKEDTMPMRTPPTSRYIIAQQQQNEHPVCQNSSFYQMHNNAAVAVNYHNHNQQANPNLGKNSLPFYQHVYAPTAYNAEYARMEAWLDENPEFVQEYFVRKATRQIVDAWLVSHATSAGSDTNSCEQTTPTSTQTGSSRGGSGASTPVRKISAHEFERGGLLKPIVNTIDGTPTFLSVNSQHACSCGNTGSKVNTTIAQSPEGVSHNINCFPVRNQFNQYTNNACSCLHCMGVGYNNSPNGSNRPVVNGNAYHCNESTSRFQRLSRNELQQLDEKELIFELVKDICNELEVRTLCHKILQNVSILLNADRGSLFLVQGCEDYNADGSKKYLVSKLFDVCPHSKAEEIDKPQEVYVPWGSGIIGHVAKSGEPVNIPDAYQDSRFNHEVDTFTGYYTKALLCMPIKDSSGDVIGVAQVINKLNGDCFSAADEKVFSSYLQFCGIGLRNAQLYEKSQLEIKRNQVLLDLARMIFEEQSTIEHMVFRILTHMQSLIQCQRVQILLVHEVDKGSFSRVFDFEDNDLREGQRICPHESRFPINIGITGYVATTGETVNIINAYDDDRFDPRVDQNTTFKHRSILCMAIKNSNGQIIGVIQLINKFDELSFTKNDENFVEAFAIFCGMGIHNTHMYEQAVIAMAKQSVTLEVLSYHASASIEEAQRLKRLRIASAVQFRLHDFEFDDIYFEDDETLKACLRMFLDLDFVERFHIDYEVLCRWLLSVKKNYRHVTYHNWRHAFNVAQMMFAILKATQWWEIFGDIECLALIVACLCHDLDHRGTNNSFQIKASSPLAQLYSTSTMEHHHFDQCLMILNSPGNQILGNLTSEDYCRVIRALEDAILSTDLAVYLKKRDDFFKAVQEQPKSYWVNEEPRALLRAMSMTVCDLSAITKPWEIEKRVADLVSSEFFEQGDVEKQQLHITPIDMMNREKENELPQMQVGFIDSICLPIYEAFSQLNENLEPLVDGVRKNRKQWTKLSQELQDKKDLKNKGSHSNAESAQNVLKINNNAKKVNKVTECVARKEDDTQKKITSKQHQHQHPNTTQQKPGNSSNNKNIKKCASEFQLASTARALNNYKPHSKSTSCIHECDRTKVSNSNSKATSATTNRVQRKNNNRNYVSKANECNCKANKNQMNFVNNSSTILSNAENHTNIPKIVGKLGNIDSLQYLPLTNYLDPAHNHHTSFLPDAAISLRRHSDTNRLRSEINF